MPGNLTDRDKEDANRKAVNCLRQEKNAVTTFKSSAFPVPLITKSITESSHFTYFWFNFPASFHHFGGGSICSVHQRSLKLLHPRILFSELNISNTVKSWIFNEPKLPLHHSFQHVMERCYFFSLPHGFTMSGSFLELLLVLLIHTFMYCTVLSLNCM